MRVWGEGGGPDLSSAEKAATDAALTQLAPLLKEATFEFAIQIAPDEILPDWLRQAVADAVAHALMGASSAGQNQRVHAFRNDENGRPEVWVAVGLDCQSVVVATAEHLACEGKKRDDTWRHAAQSWGALLKLLEGKQRAKKSKRQ